MLGLDKAVVERVEYDDAAGGLVASVRPKAREAGRCGVCRKRSPGYDGGRGRRRWRSLDAGTMLVWIEAEAPRVRCRRHGVTVASVPWARHGAGHTRDFDATAAWMATNMAKTSVCALLRIAWPTVGSIIERVGAETDARIDRLAGLERIGIDEISYKKGQKYLTIVVDHDSGRLVWAGEGTGKKVLAVFFASLGPGRCQAISQVSADAAAWIAEAVKAYCPNAVQAADPFHVVKWATEELDEVRKDLWRRVRRGEGTNADHRGAKISKTEALAVKHSRFALWKNPENLTEKQRAKLDWIAATHPMLYRAWKLKEGLRLVFALGGEDGKAQLDYWLSWAARCRIPGFVRLGQRIRSHRETIDVALETGLSNGLIESTNTKIRVLTRMAYGFKSAGALIALAMLALGGYRPDLPGRPSTIPPTHE
nr:ISL3 family transposase [Glycomyces sp. L485]